MAPVITAAVLLCFQFCHSFTYPTIAEWSLYSEVFALSHGAAYYVAPNGSDAGSGKVDQPWASIEHAAQQAVAGDTIIVRGGRYGLSSQVRFRNSGRPGSWITFVGYPGETPILDAQQLSHALLFREGLDNGAFQIQAVSYVRVINLTVINSHDAGFTVRDSSNIDLINNRTIGTFSSGIAVWDTNHQGSATQRIRILGNKIEKPTTWDLAPPNIPKIGQAPQEALSIAGAVDFEVAYNEVYDSNEGGIDIKETSKRGKVHHNLVHNIGLGIYVDSWFGELNQVEIYSNVVYSCLGAGIALSVENGNLVEGIDIHDNLVFNNKGSGLYFSRWGVNNERRNIQIHNNTFYHNGYGAPKPGQTYYWMTGGIYLYSTNVHNIAIKNNILSKNRGFQVGYSELFLKDATWPSIARAKKIEITGNLIDGSNAANSPIESGGDPHDRVKIYGVDGDRAIVADPLFEDPATQDFTLRRDSPARAGRIVAGADLPHDLWWAHDFPPTLFVIHFD
jgi:hypothetical protein